MKHEPRTLTDDELRYRIKNGGDIIIDVCTELLARRDADKKWQPANKPIWIASRYGNIWKVASGYVSALLERDMYMLIADDNPPEPPEPPVQP